MNTEMMNDAYVHEEMKKTDSSRHFLFPVL